MTQAVSLGSFRTHRPVKGPSKKPSPSDRYASYDLRLYIFRRDCGQCQYCGRTVSFADCNIDHIIPWPRGRTVKSNLVVSCPGCNRLKGSALIPAAYRPWP